MLKHKKSGSAEADTRSTYQRVSMKKFSAAAAVSILVLSGVSAQAQEALKVGVLVTLSGPPAAIGEQIKDGFELAVEQMDGKLGGRDVEVVVEDDEMKPDVAVSKANALVERDNVDFVVGPVFSNMLQAIMKPIADSDTILISPNAGTSNFAGAECNPNFFVSAIQNDQQTSAMGTYANANGIDKVIAIVPNYQAGRDMVAGFKTTFEGELMDEVYVPLGQLDYSAELTRVSLSGAPAIFTFLPGGMGVNFIKQFDQAGLNGKVKVLSVFTADEVTLPAQKDAALGVLASSNWAPDLDNEQNKNFVSAYMEKYGSVPGSYAANAYDAALMLDAALKATGGDASDTDAVRAALETVEFPSVRGSFKFNTNHYPIQDVILTKVGKTEDGLYETQYVETIEKDSQDPYVSQCTMN